MTSLFVPPLHFPWTDSDVSSDVPAMAVLQSPSLSVVASRIHWEFHDLVIAYTMLRDTVLERDTRLDAEAEDLKVKRASAPDDASHLKASRLGEAIMSEDMMLRQIGRVSIRSTVVNSWILAEGVLGAAYAELYGASNSGAIPKKSYRWDEFVSKFKGYGIVLSDLPAFENANLCRLVNNCIKHDGVITATMAESGLFAGLEDQKLRDIDFDHQPLISGVQGFCVAVLEAADEKL